MTIIVTGGAGFIGSNFIFHMLNKYPDYRIICLDCLTYAGNLSTLEPVMDNPNFRFVKESITDRDAVYKLFEEEHPDMVVNFAAESHVDRSVENPGVFLHTNIIGTQVLMDACRKYGIKLIIRCLRMRCTAICRLTAPICFLQRTRRSIPQARIRRPRLLRICLFWHITVRSICRFRLHAVPTTTVRITSRKNSFR